MTVNVDDFWRAAPADSHYCIVCAGLPAVRVAPTLPGWLRRLFALPGFKTKAARLGKVVLRRPRQIAYYENDNRLHALAWPE